MTRGLDDQTLTFYETKPLTLKSSNKQSWYFSPFCHRKSRKQTGSVLGLILPQKVHFLSWNMYVWYTIEVISRAFHLNMEYNFHKFEILFDTKFSLDLNESSDALRQTYKLIDYSNSNHIHHISLVSTQILLIQFFSTYIYVEP